MLRIDSPENKIIKIAASLKHRKYREGNGMFLVEGQRSVMEAMRRPDLVETVLIDEIYYEGVSPELPNQNTVIVKNGLLKRISDTENSQGIMALVKKPPWDWRGEVLSSRIILLLDQVADPGNLGSMLRTGWGLGVGAVLLSKGCADPFSPKVVRSTMGAIINLPMFCDITDQHLESLQESGFDFVCTDVSEGISYYDASYLRPSIIIMGSEARGVDPKIKARCCQLINIPLKSGVDSLNVAAACAIILAEAWRQRLSVPGEDQLP